MQQYPVKSRNHPPLTLERIEATCRQQFEDATREGDRVKASYGAIAELHSWVAGRELAIDLRMNPQVESAVQSETIRRYNRFLEELTGFSSKERAKRLKKTVAPSDTSE